MVRKLVYLAALTALWSTVAAADVIYVTPTSYVTDANVPASASADFSINGNQLVLVLSNTMVDPWQDSQNVGAISFQLYNYGSPSTFLTGTLVSITGKTITQTPLNTDVSSYIVSGGASTTNTPWASTAKGTNMNTGANYTSLFAIGPYSIAGIPNASNEYTPQSGCPDGSKEGKNGGCGSSAEYGQNSGDDPMIFETATFVFNVSGLPSSADLQDISSCTALGQTCIKNVQFGFGPDGPDEDDITYGVYNSSGGGGTLGGETPEPFPLVLIGTGLIFLGLLGLRRRRAHR